MLLAELLGLKNIRLLESTKGSYLMMHDNPKRRRVHPSAAKDKKGQKR
jgi:hypothetical protein